MNKTNEDSIWNRQFIRIIIINSLAYLGFIFIVPIMSEHVIQLGATVSFSGIIVGAFSMTALVVRPFSGQILEWFNPNKSLFVALTVMAVLTCGYGVIKSAGVIFVLRIVHGVFFCVFSTLSSSIGASLLPQKKLGQGIGYLGLGMILMGAVGPSLVPYVVNAFGRSSAFFIASILIFISALLVAKLRVPAHRLERNREFSLRLSKIIPAALLIPMMLGALASLLNSLVSSFLLLLGSERGISNISIYFLVSAAFLLLSRLVFGRRIDTKSLGSNIYPAFGFIIVTAILFAFTKSLLGILSGAALYGIGLGVSQPTLQAHCIKKMGIEQVGIATSTFFIGLDFSQGLGPVIGGIIIDHFGFRVLFLLVAALVAGGMGLLFVYQARTQHDHAGIAGKKAA